ncbi:CRISPR-associated helicase Cas3' [Paracoccus shandongensis]|uniref:CRISPR-associated helicase Cas3' n=1 Tax=Paracoccus shandongensis TaxID=2816048 RepID=UPI001A8E5F6A|nr:CRISPR-associated helicase Cas3' [Paracoccus shandongensis]
MQVAQIGRWPGKSPVLPGQPSHPAVYHMLDVAAVAEVLLADHPRRDLFCLLIALHDLGKIGNVFRDMLLNGTVQDRKHWEVTEAWLLDKEIERLLLNRLDGRFQALRPLVSAIAGHHGKPPRTGEHDWKRMRDRAGDEARADAMAFVQGCLDLWPEARLNGLRQNEAKTLTWFLAGVTTVADWVGSNTEWFAPQSAGPTLAEYLDDARQRAPDALRAAGLLPPLPKDDPLFDFALRPMQRAARDIALPPGPMLAIIEDETGAGKTEAAFILAQRMLCAGKGRGLYVALPTMATADAMFRRARKVVSGLFQDAPSLTLAHGRAGLSVEFRDVRNTAPGSDDPVCGDWLAASRRRALLADVGVGTIDQALLAVLPTRFATLRNWGLSRKILIVDEAHELGEPYMAHELATLLRLHAMQGGSAILLTATLPLDLRARLSRAFAEGAGQPFAEDRDPAYPSLSIPAGASVRSFDPPEMTKGDVAVNRLPDADAALDLLARHAAAGAACVWVRNAVDDAISAVAALRARGIAADLLHARFTLADRKRIEAGMMARFGRDGTARQGRVLVGTQVLESSLDLDFDVMVSDLAPIASLIQRAGRLWRHMDLRPADLRPVPAPVLHVVSPDPAAVADDRWLHGVLDRGAWVYPLADQWRTAAVLAEAGALRAPGNLRALIEAVHGRDARPVPPALERAELETIGEGHARSSHARQATIRIEEGYRDGGGGSDDAEYPTRLGQPTRTLLLLRREEGRLRFWSGDADACDTHARAEAEALSEVSASAARLAGLDLPDQKDPELAGFSKDWPDWRKASVTLCVVEDGRICEGLAYDGDLGLLFGQGPEGMGPKPS